MASDRVDRNYDPCNLPSKPSSDHSRPIIWHEPPSALGALTKAEKRWVLWRYELKEKPNGEWKWDKPPYQAFSDLHASTSNPRTWTTFDRAQAAARTGKFDGLGFCLLKVRLAVFDIDDCRDPATGKVDEWARHRYRSRQLY
jgi:primase-polymerase (primpol)-like protein